MRLRASAAWLAALAATVACGSSSQAYNFTLGPPELPPPQHRSAFECRAHCTEPFTLAQHSSSYLDVAPASGVVTNWRTSGEGTPPELRVLEPSPDGGWVGAGTSAPAANLEGGSNPTELPVGRGDLIGADIRLGTAVEDAEFEGSSGGELLTWTPVLSEGGTGQAGVPYDLGTPLIILDAEVEATPIVTSVSPASGPAAGGNTVTITGRYLDSALNVVFGSRPATTFSVDLSGEHITAQAPVSAAGTVDIRVSNLHSTSETVAADRYTFVASAPPPAGPAPAQGVERTAPLVNAFSQSVGRWRLGGALPHTARTPVGTTFTFGLNETAGVALTFMRVLPGRRAGSSCVTPTRRNLNRPRCRRNVLAGSLAVSGHPGLNKLRFQGRLSRTTRLTPGSYTVGVTARDSDGLTSVTRSLSFAIVP